MIPDSGCQECGVCHHALLDETDALKREIDPVIVDFNTIAGGYFTSQKLNYYDVLTTQLKPKVGQLKPDSTNELTILNQVISSLEMDAKNHNRKVTYQNSEELSKGSDSLLEKANDFIDVSHLDRTKAANTIREVKKLADSITTSDSSTMVENALNEAKDIVKQLEDYTMEESDSQRVLAMSEDLKRKVEDSKRPVNAQKLILDELNNHTKAFGDKQKDLTDWSNDVLKKVAQANELHEMNDNSPVFTKMETLVNQTKQVEDNIKNTTNYLSITNLMIEPIYRNYADMEKINKVLVNKTGDGETDFFPTKEIAYQGVLGEIEMAEKHSDGLQSTADKLGAELTNIASSSEQALRAANAYSDIVKAVDTARKAIRNATYAAGNSTELSVGTEDRAYKADQDAMNLLDTVKESLRSIQDELQPKLNESSINVENIRNVLKETTDLTNSIQALVDNYCMYM